MSDNEPDGPYGTPDEYRYALERTGILPTYADIASLAADNLEEAERTKDINATTRAGNTAAQALNDALNDLDKATEMVRQTSKATLRAEDTMKRIVAARAKLSPDTRKEGSR